jgi:hypothetical protein
MSRVVSLGSCLALGIVAWAAVAVPAVAATASMDLFQRALDPHPKLHSYTASAQLAAQMHNPLPLRKTFTGTAWYLEPNLKIAFDNVPNSLKSFKELSVSAAAFEGTSAQYTVTPGADDGTTSTYTLVPKKAGARVKQLTIKVDNASAKINQAVWSYTDGSQLTVTPTYSTVSGMRIASQQQISAHFPKYSVDGTLTLSNFKINVPVDPKIFASPPPQ